MMIDIIDYTNNSPYKNWTPVYIKQERYNPAGISGVAGLIRQYTYELSCDTWCTKKLGPANLKWHLDTLTKAYVFKSPVDALAFMLEVW